MRNRVQFHVKTVRTDGQIPNYSDLVWVQCDGYKCLAYTDETGKWMNFYTGEELTDIVKVIG